MPPKEQQAKLADIISYTPETYFSDEEVTLLRNAFNGPTGARLLKVVRKALLPTIADADLPIEEFGKDVFMSAIDFKMMPVEEVKPTILGLQMAVKIVMGSLIQLKNIANVKEPSAQELANARAKNSSK